jgi:hypothetical protein
MAVHYLEGISCVLVQDMQTILYITLYASTILEYEGLRLLIKSSDSGLIPVAKKGPLVVHFQVCMVPLIDRVLNLVDHKTKVLRTILSDMPAIRISDAVAIGNARLDTNHSCDALPL